MKNILFFLLLTLFSSSIFSQEKFTDLHYRGGLYYEINSQEPYTGEKSNYLRGGGPTLNGEEHYSYTSYTIKDGVIVYIKKWFTMRFNNEQVDLLRESFYPNGIIKERTIYDPNGSGQIKEKKSYNEDGLLHGEYISYYISNGQIREKGTYKNGQWDGPYVSYRLDGTIIMKGNYKNGKKVK
jgi:antitoxin component YwqK of YwqJK toxin-antitoxin module